MYKINYSVVSRGTEKYINSGYISIIRDKNKTIIVPMDHNIKYIEKIDIEKALITKSTELYNIIFSRFQLISKLMINNLKNKIKIKKEKILIIGSGNIGITLINELYQNKIKTVDVVIRNDKKVKLIKNIFSDKVNVKRKLSDLEKYSLIIDTTGESDVIEKIIEECSNFTKIVLLGTPREINSNVLLKVHRKNLFILGAHEINGYSNKYRNKIFNRLIKDNSKIDFFDKIISIKKYNSNIYFELLNQENEKIMNVFEY